LNKAIKWRLRRGVLELDHILSGFYAKEYETLSDSEKKDFETLLELSDPELLSLIVYKKIDQESPLLNIIKKIHAYSSI
tara:strand:+ start:1147 stop:1383 length:237 start_codon:yes stop_codon:yes gene_type:complete